MARSKADLVREALLEASQAGVWLTQRELRKITRYEGNGLLNALYVQSSRAINCVPAAGSRS